MKKLEEEEKEKVDAETKMKHEQFMMNAIEADRSEMLAALHLFLRIGKAMAGCTLVCDVTKEDAENIVKHWAELMERRGTCRLPHVFFDTNVVICGKLLRDRGLVSDTINPRVKADIEETIARVKEYEKNHKVNWVKQYEEKSGVSVVNWGDDEEEENEDVPLGWGDDYTGGDDDTRGDDDTGGDVQRDATHPQQLVPGGYVDVEELRAGDIVFVRYGQAWEKVDLVYNTKLYPQLGCTLSDGMYLRLYQFGKHVKSAVTMDM